MNQRTITHLLMALLLCLLLAAPSLADGSTEPEAPQTTTVDSDRLPFMQQEQAPAYQEPSSGSLVLKTLGSLLVIVGLIFVGAWGAKKLGLGGVRSGDASGKADLAMLSSISLGSGRTIATVQFGSRLLLVGSTAHSFTLLAEENRDAGASLHSGRSVAEMLAEETASFDSEFKLAQTNLNRWEETGESRS
jgi:flagellar biogenesis protein FliO